MDGVADAATLELDLPPEALPPLLRLPAVAGSRAGRAQSQALRIVWHDTAAASLAGDGLALAELRDGWRLERLRPDGSGNWPPATPAPVLARAGTAAELHPPANLVPVAAFEGRERTFPLGPEPVTIRVLEGVLRAVAQEAPCCRIRLSGPPAVVAALADRLAEDAPLAVPRDGIAAVAIGMARGERPAHRTGAPHVAAGMDVSTALAAIIGHLTDVIAHHATGAAAGEEQAIHQMRVALRRLRSAIAVFRRAADCPGLQHAAAGLKASAAVLGEARDWDVFLAETVPPVASAFPEDRRIAGLIAAAGRRRRDAHAALRAHLAEPGFRRLLLSLAALPLLRPWTAQDDRDHEPDPDPGRAELLALPVADYAARRLARMRDRLLAETEAIETLSPPAMHAVRKRCKKLRYACEFFEDLYPAKPARRFTRRLARLQDDLGTLNDAAVAASLTARLGGGAARAFGVGVVQGFVVAGATRARGDLARRRDAWRRQPVFWS